MSNQPLETPVQYLKGVGPKLAKIFAKIGINTVEDLFFFIPRDWEDRSIFMPIAHLVPADKVLIKAEIVETESQLTRSRFSILRVRLKDASGSIQAVWFNQPFLEPLFRRGMRLIVSGKVEISSFDGVKQLLVHDFEIDTGENQKIVPVYPLTEGLYPKKIRLVIKEALDKYSNFISDKKIRQSLQTLHLPEDLASIPKARDYLVYEELLNFQLGLLVSRKKYKEEVPGNIFTIDQNLTAEIKGALSFELTGSQQKVLSEIYLDLQSGHPMNRLLQGDVGSGKTVIAQLAALAAIRNGFQVVVLVPTEILAQQHFAKMAQFFGALKIGTDLVTASTRKAKNQVDSMETELIVGTHALIEEKIKFKKLGLVVIDEQHRFGVEQRASLIKKGISPHVLVMTATPIPRSLALTLYGDLDRSIIDELPPGRTPIKTYFIPKQKRREANEFIRAKLKEGRQAFVVCPLVEETSELDLKAAKEEAARLQEDIYPEFKVGLIHGKIKGKDKDLLMKDFLNNKINLLVSTTVIEVGIDIPNATIMLIEHAERFGLSQLHQLRGRIGRGSAESFCFLVGNPKSVEAKARLKAMLETNDGFKIAEADLRLRGPGDFYGVRQSGLPSFRVADIIKDEKILLKARKAAEDLIAKDPQGAHNRWESQRPAFERAQKRWEPDNCRESPATN